MNDLLLCTSGIGTDVGCEVQLVTFDTLRRTVEQRLLRTSVIARKIHLAPASNGRQARQNAVTHE
ncbi:hypothetical protein [Polyangium sp. y55x31]|uniref:hypothetical protein n=1 Tax=Polyangium sp. y55x31 TaxID=3042688 RepID=UPI00248300C5|nr:hypothetical protein [Polyangium sp. y55x31]MDI1478615.1 hypothetical protein [Polyangium sp. y55x31]